MRSQKFDLLKKIHAYLSKHEGRYLSPFEGRHLVLSGLGLLDEPSRFVIIAFSSLLLKVLSGCLS